MLDQSLESGCGHRFCGSCAVRLFRCPIDKKRIIKRKGKRRDYRFFTTNQPQPSTLQSLESIVKSRENGSSSRLTSSTSSSPHEGSNTNIPKDVEVSPSQHHDITDLHESDSPSQKELKPTLVENPPQIHQEIIPSKIPAEEKYEFRLYLRLPLAEKYSEARIRKTFEPFCPLKRIRRIDSNSACVTLDDDATFDTYDRIYFRMIEKSDAANPNKLFVEDYENYVGTSSIEENLTKNLISQK